MSGDEYLKFEITEDDIQNEFTQHKTRRFTKNQQIYGMWADDDDSEDDNRGRKFSKTKKNYTAPVNFIAGGVHQPGQDKSKAPEPEKTEEDELFSDSSDEELRPSSSQRNTRPEASSFSESDLAGFRKSGVKMPTALIQQGVGNWEKHTKGIGAKLLLKMGYQPGKGLGKTLQGIDAPIEAHLRKGRGAIGAYGPEKKQKKMKSDSAVKEETETNKLEISERTSLWRKEGSESTKKIRYVYKSIDEVLEESKKPGKKKIEISELSKVKVIDMTGPEQRILSGYHAIAGVQKPAEEWEVRKDKKFSNFAMPELQHNLNLLVDVSKETIIENSSKIDYAVGRLELLHNQVKDFGRTLKQEKLVMDSLKNMIDTVESVVQSSKEKSLSLDKAEEIISSLKNNHYTEFCAYEIPVLAVNVVRPLLKEYLENWKPLEDPKMPIPEFVKWRNILLIEDTAGQTLDSYKLNPYYKLVWDTWVPCVRAATNSWECRQWSPMVDLIMNWMPLISKWILENILRDMILRRIQYQVEEWNPLTDRVPIHSWIYPWIAMLAKSFETSVYPTIRQKLSKALLNWHPSDSSARLMLQPWMSVFDQGEMEAFLVNNIVPKLQIVLQEFIINPHQQCLDNWNWTMEWSEMIPAHTMAGLLDRCFFPKWLQTLSVWLNMNPDLDQVRKWFSGWKTIIPDSIRAQPIVCDHIRTALELMSKAFGGAPAPERAPRSSEVSGEDLTPVFRKLSVTSYYKKPCLQEPVEAVRITEVPVSLKSMVQAHCEEKGILWVPIPNRFMEAKQVYRCGKLQVYFDRNVLFVSQGGGTFIPMSWQEMLENAI